MDTSNIAVFIFIPAMSALSHFLPKLTRPDLFFGVTVDPTLRNTDEARRILRNYRIALWAVSLVAAALDLAMHRPGVALILYAVGACCAQVASNRSALHHAAPGSATIEIDLSAPPEHIPGGLPAAFLPLIALLGLGLWAVTHVDQLPNRLPVHWGLDGPNLWVVTSSRAITLLLAEHALICLVLIASALGVLHWSRRISISGPSAAPERQFRRRTVLLMLVVEYFTVLPPVLGLLQAPVIAMKIWGVALVVTVVAFVISLMHAGQGGARRGAAGRGPIGDRTADARWIGGLLYFNPTDPAVLVERRMGIGWTVNLGNPWSWAAVIAVAVILLTLPLAVRGGPNLAVGGPVQRENAGTPLRDVSATKEPIRWSPTSSIRRSL